MNQYLLEILLPKFPGEDFFALIPEQRKMVNDFMRDGIISSYSLSLDRTHLWMTMVGLSEKSILNVVNEFPLAKFMSIKIHPLTFHVGAGISIPQVSLN
ncbi:MAG: hypothetical protein KGZ58_07210 [Ignavibacteriales bacterium]|nr:hypothetical protein [Ignavibacteriales bacterium]